jgi:hypothetical protein
MRAVTRALLDVLKQSIAIRGTFAGARHLMMAIWACKNRSVWALPAPRIMVGGIAYGGYFTQTQLGKMN